MKGGFIGTMKEDALCKTGVNPNGRRNPLKLT
jgi:hypothetical protein